MAEEWVRLSDPVTSGTISESTSSKDIRHQPPLPVVLHTYDGDDDDDDTGSGMTVEVDLHRVHSQPEEAHREHETLNNDLILNLDDYGFIRNMDSHGNVYDDSLIGGANEDADLRPNFQKEYSRQKNTERWNVLVKKNALWNFKRPNRRKKTLIQECRQGIPHTLRPQLWKRLRNIQARIDSHPSNYYKTLIDQAIDEESHAHKSLQETIERDLMRTFPRHSLFYENHQDAVPKMTTIPSGDAHDDVDGDGGNGGNSNAYAGDDYRNQHRHEHEDSEVDEYLEEDVVGDIIQELEQQQAPNQDNRNAVDAEQRKSIHDAQEGHAQLRRLLKAYSVYDKQVGYCQGMNFIAGMFLTVMQDEQTSFWMLVSIMNEEPGKMRPLFLEGMRDTHKVLFVAEKLVERFLPKLYKHFQQEHIHFTMFATQWLLTQYTSSFPFDLVMRFWDSFLAEGWKITYRVMLALLQKAQSDLLQLQFEDILAYFRDLPDTVRADSIMDTALKIPLKRAHMALYEREFDKQSRQGSTTG